MSRMRLVRGQTTETHKLTEVDTLTARVVSAYLKPAVGKRREVIEEETEQTRRKIGE